MSILIYEYLKIEPTEDVQQLLAAYANKAAIINSAKNLEQSSEFIRFSVEFLALIQEPKNLARYFESYKRYHLDEANREDPIIVGNTELVRIFVQVHVSPPFDRTAYRNPPGEVMDLEKYTEQISREEFDQQFDLKRLAAAITFRSTNYTFQVGTTASEVKKIVNLHSHYYQVLIVQILVPRTCLSETRQTEQQQNPFRLDDRYNSNYYWLNRGTQIQATDIISISANEEYQETRRFIDDTPIKDIWPQNHILVVKSGFELTQQANKSTNDEAGRQSRNPITPSTTPHFFSPPPLLLNGDPLDLKTPAVSNTGH